MSEKPSEYLKRTCLICGCHTNQTINIYEPRSGPNIVQLIQAKFKFQPLNEDKYLCFSCNNWLINWHSLQALNSNDAESPSGTFRSHMNSIVPEKGAGSQQHACRPVAQVRPLQLETTIPTMSLITAPLAAADSMRELKDKISRSNSVKPNKGRFYMKRNFRTTNRYQSYRQRLKSLQCCCVCGRAIVIRKARTALKCMSVKKSITAKCRKCREVCKWRTIYLRSLIKADRKTKAKSNQSLVNINSNETKNMVVVESRAPNQNQATCDYLQKPRVDGKIVAMLRRLGTTLSREATELQQQQQHSKATSDKLPPIMSPAKQKPQWTRQLDDDEILLDFNTAISEVLPRIAQLEETQATCDGKQARRMLTYQMTNDLNDRVIDLEETSNESEIEKDTDVDTEIDSEAEAMTETQIRACTKNPQQWQPLASIYNILPKGLSVSFI